MGELNLGATTTARFWHHYGGKQAIVHGLKPRTQSGLALGQPCRRSPARFHSLFSPHRALWVGEEYQRGRRYLIIFSGRDHGEDHSCRGRKRYAALFGEVAAERPLRRD